MDHINGVRDDHRLENLRLVCPNCNATLPTYCGKKAFKETRISKREAGADKRFGGEARISLRRVKRPSHKKLLQEIEVLGYSGVGRKYGVSDNAIRKWVQCYEKHGV